jgi:hypothetical protein
LVSLTRGSAVDSMTPSYVFGSVRASIERGRGDRPRHAGSVTCWLADRADDGMIVDIMGYTK